MFPAFLNRVTKLKTLYANETQEKSTEETELKESEGITQSNSSEIDMSDMKDFEFRTVIFIRHGNSVWNQSTDLLFRNPMNAAKAISALGKGFKEYAMLKISNDYKHENSEIIDTPLSKKGMKQAYNLSKFLKNHRSFRDHSKLLYLQELQNISSPIKDSWRSLQQYKIDLEKNNINPPDLCNDSLKSLKIAIQRIEVLMANAKPFDCIDLDDNNYNYNHNHNHNHNIPNHGISDIPMSIDDILDILIGKNMPSIIVTSNLRRAISTAVIGLWPRLKYSNEKVFIASCLQEIGINVDTQTVTAQFSVPNVSNFEQMTENLDSKSLTEFYETRLETLYNYGSKSNILESMEDTKNRLNLFAKWIFMKKESNSLPNKEKNHIHHGIKPAIIAVGHSTWLKQFLALYLPKKSDFIGKEKKLSNCGIISFQFYWDKKHDKYGIIESSLTVVYKGFGDS